MAKLPEHCSGKLSQLLNALALTMSTGLRRKQCNTMVADDKNEPALWRCVPWQVNV